MVPTLLAASFDGMAQRGGHPDPQSSDTNDAELVGESERRWRRCV
jgi:hypothetical protein